MDSSDLQPQPQPQPQRHVQPRLSAHRARAVELPDDAFESAAVVLDLIHNGETSVTRSGAIEAANVRLQRLRSDNVDTVLTELACQLLILDGVAKRYISMSMLSNSLDAQVRFGKMGLSAASTYQRALVVYQTLKSQAKGRATITVETEEASDE